MERLRVELLGPAGVTIAQQPVTFPTRKTAALLYYLAVEGGLHPRDRLIALLWPESDEERARGSLRSALNFLRGALQRSAGDDGAAALLVDRDTLGIDAARVDLDLRPFAAAYALARTLPRRPPEATLAQLHAAVDRYRGDFLEGFVLPDAPEFDDWLVANREGCHAKASALLDRLSLAYAEGGERQRAIELAQRWLALDRLNEAAYRRLMRLQGAQGDGQAAWRTYSTCRTVLAKELNAEPSPETQALAARLRRQAPLEQEPPLREPSIPLVTTDAPLVGRLAEHALLVDTFASARRGKTAAVVVEGEAGIGKTRLATEFLRWAHANGSIVLAGKTLATGTRLPYQVIVEALRPHVERAVDVRHLLAPVWLAELSVLWPELRERQPDLPPPLAAGETDQGARLFEAVSRLVIALAQQAPVVLFLDDLQWADAASLHLLQYGLRRWSAASAHLLTVGTARTEALVSGSPLSDWLQVVGRDVPLTRLSLGLLSRGHTTRLAALIGMEQQAAWLHAETGGHPFYLAQTVKALYERGLLRAEPHGLRMVGDERQLSGVIAPGVRETVRDRLARLSPPARAVLAAAAVLGDGAAPAPLTLVAGQAEDTLLTALDEVLARRLLREANGRYYFGHDKIREVVYDEATAIRRQAYHRRALAALSTGGAPAAELARHALGAGADESACRWSVTAGDEALRLFGVRDAIAHYERARMLIESAGADAASRHHLFMQLGRAYELVADYAKARATYEVLLASTRAAGDRCAECLALNQLAVVASHDQLDRDAVADLLGEAEAVATAAGDRAGLAKVEWNVSRLHLYRNDFARAREHGRRSLALAREIRDREHAARSLNWLALSGIMVGELLEAQAQAAEAQALYEALGDRAMQADSLVQLAAARNRYGQPRDALEPARAASAISVAIENPWGQADSARELALALLELGQYGKALDLAETAAKAARQASYVPLTIMCLAVLGAAQRHLGMLDEALATHQEASSAAEVARHPMFYEMVAGELCADHALGGAWAQAAQLAHQTLAARGPGLPFVGATRQYETAALLRAGDRAVAIDDLCQFSARAARSPRYQLSYLRAKAALEAWDGELAAATAHLEEAETIAQRGELLGERWEIVTDQARLFRIRGEEVHARRCEREGAALLGVLSAGIDDPVRRERFLRHAERLSRGP